MTSPACPSTHPEADKENQENRGDIINSSSRQTYYKKSISFPKKKKTTEALRENLPPKKKGRKELSDLWDLRFEELKAFKLEHGHCNVPRTWLANPQLGTWLNTQRKQYRLSKQGMSSKMIPARIHKLEQLGFQWSLCEKQDWDVRFQELVQYRKKHGDCLVPQRYTLNPQLGIWVNNQRTQYRTFKEEGVGPMTAERAQKLQDLGFIWNVSKRRKKDNNANHACKKGSHRRKGADRNASSSTKNEGQNNQDCSTDSPTTDDSSTSSLESYSDAAAAKLLIRLF